MKTKKIIRQHRIAIKETDGYSLGIFNYLKDVDRGCIGTFHVNEVGQVKTFVTKQSICAIKEMTDTEEKKLRNSVTILDLGLHLMIQKIREIHDGAIFDLVNSSPKTSDKFERKLLKEMKILAQKHYETYKDSYIRT